jgi:hypothetical protein
VSIPLVNVSRSRDLCFAVTERLEDLIGFRGWRAAKEGLSKVGIDIFPDDFALFGDFEKPAERSLIDQCIAVRKALSVVLAMPVCIAATIGCAMDDFPTLVPTIFAGVALVTVIGSTPLARPS